MEVSVSTRPQDESIYTLQRRIGVRRVSLDARAEATDLVVRSPARSEPQRRRFKLAALFSMRIRPA
jgi:hypothetical protein